MSILDKTMDRKNESCYWNITSNLFFSFASPHSLSFNDGDSIIAINKHNQIEQTDPCLEFGNPFCFVV